MSWALSYSCSYSFTSASCTLLVILLLLLGLSSQSCNGLGTFGFGTHHRFSDTVKAIPGADGLPKKGSVGYYAATARPDRITQGRHFAASNNQSPLTFANGNNRLTDFSILAKEGLGSNYFSVCFGPDHKHGRINFGDGGSLDRKETPFTIMQSLPYYKIGLAQITVDLAQITVGSSSSKLEFSATFDSSTSLTILRDPAYTLITNSFTSQVKETPSRGTWGLFHLDYCYTSSNLNFPKINLTLKGGGIYSVIDPILPMDIKQGRYHLYCLGISKGGDSDYNIIGQSFMTGYRLVFNLLNREKVGISWNASNCSYSPSQSPPTLVDNSNSPPQSPLALNGNSNSPPQSPPALNGNSDSPPESPPAPNCNSNSPPESPPPPNHNSNSPQSPPPESPPASNHNSYSLPESPPPESPLAPNYNSNSPPESPPAPNRNSNSPPESSPAPTPAPAPNHNSNSLPTTQSQSLPFSPPLAAGSPGNDYHVPTTPLYMINHSPELKSFTCGLMMLLVSFVAIV